MAGKRSFKDYVAKIFYYEMFSAINSFLSDRSDNFDLQLKRVKNFEGIEFDVFVEFELVFRETNYHHSVFRVRI